MRFGTFYADQVDCRISGRVFIDLNKNGVQDAGEPGYANVDLLLGGAGDYNRVVATDSTGKYTFSGLPTGNYPVTLQLNSDQYWITTSPGSYNFTFPIQTRVDTAYFGVVIIHQTASIAGTVFNDTNYNTV